MIHIPTFQKYFEEIGQKPYRIKQIYRAVHKEAVSSFEDISVLSKDLRNQIASDISFSSISIKTSVKSQIDGTQKVLFETHDGKFMEAVLLHQNGRVTLCMSTQIGCAMNCDFCATGKLGLTRNLSVEEMVDQVLHFKRELMAQDKRIDNIVLMGMGEPFQNYDNVLEALEYINDPYGIEVGQRHITISTCGITPKIYDFADHDKQFNLAISLHAPTQELRASFMPVSKAYDLDGLMDAIRYYQEKTNRRIFYEYTLMSEVNDSDELAHQLGKLLAPQLPLAHVNLLRWNPNDQGQYKAPSNNRVHQFSQILQSYGVPTTFRHSKGDDIDAACGQLASKDNKSS